MIILSPSLVAQLGADPNVNNPVIGYRNLVTTANITATTQAEGFPATNLANPATDLLWVADPSGDEYLTVAIADSDPVDYVGIARHNLGSAQIPVSIEGDDGSGWSELVGETLLADDKPVIFRWEPQSLAGVRVRMQEGSAPPEAAVLYVGRLLVIPRRIYVGHTPMPYGREVTVINGVSESGNFLGRIVVGETRSTSVSLKNLDPAWYRQHMDPFVAAGAESPFFWAWRPGTYPYETGFGWFPGGVPRPTNDRPNGMMAIDFDLRGVA